MLVSVHWMALNSEAELEQPKPEDPNAGVLAASLCGNRGPDGGGWILLGESSTTAAPILKTVDLCLDSQRSD